MCYCPPNKATTSTSFRANYVTQSNWFQRWTTALIITASVTSGCEIDGVGDARVVKGFDVFLLAMFSLEICIKVRRLSRPL